MHDAPTPTQPRVYRLSGDAPHGRLAISASPEWKALYFHEAGLEAVEPRIPAGYILGVRALKRRDWRVWLMRDVPNPNDRLPFVWQMDVHNTTGQAACLFALRKHESPAVTVTTDADGNVLSMEDAS